MPESTTPKQPRRRRLAIAPTGRSTDMDKVPREQALREAIELFFFSYRAFTARPDRILAARGLGRVHHRILYFIGREPGISVSELLAVLGVTKQALNAPLRKLTDAKLISVETPASDRRVRMLRLTRDGRQLEARLTGTQMDHLGPVFDSDDAQAVDAWRRLMQAIAAS